MRNILNGTRYANVASTLALVVALGGTGAYAAATIGSEDITDNSIKSVDIGKKQVKTSDLANNAVKTAKVKDGSLLAADFAAGQIPAGPAGPQGPKGDKGDKGDPGSSGIIFGDFASNATVQVNTETGGIPVAALSHVAASGEYCFDTALLPFKPRSAQVSADNSFAANDTIVSVLVFNTSGTCQVRVRTRDSANAVADRPFTIWLIP